MTGSFIIRTINGKRYALDFANREVREIEDAPEGPRKPAGALWRFSALVVAAYSLAAAVGRRKSIWRYVWRVR